MPTHDLAVRVRTPSRLHFGLLAFGEASPRQFGGVGVMIERPGNELTVRPAGAASGDGRSELGADARAGEFLRRFRDSLDPAARCQPLELTVHVTRSAPEHVGLGTGTQLAMAVARAAAVFAGRGELAPEELARRVRRGDRSAIGVHGFYHGGFLVDGGKKDLATISPLVARLNFPEDWHLVLVIPPGAQGLHGRAEREAFGGLAPIAPAITAQLCRLTLLGMLPSIAERDFAGFSAALSEYGRKVGECFAACQGGVYADPRAPEIIDAIHRQGVRGIAQSSWGPTLCAVTESRLRGEWLAARLPDAIGDLKAEIVCTTANNLGARIEVVAID